MRSGLNLVIHTVKRGESAFSIAAAYGIELRLLLETNGLAEGESLIPGQSLLILFPKTVYTVRRGDTLYSIARNFGISYRQLLRNNPQYVGFPFIDEGDRIIISFNSEKRGTIETNGYAYPYVTKEILNSSLPYMTYLSPFTYGITEDGSLVPLDDKALLAAAEEYSVRPLMHLSTLTKEGNFSNELASVILNSPELQEKLIDAVRSTIVQKDYSGLDIDFEFVFPEDSSLYAEFVEKLRNELSPLGKVVFSALAPKTSDNQKGTLYEGHNYRLLGSASDAVLLMTYEWGYTYEHI